MRLPCLAPLSALWDRAPQERCCPASAHEPVRASPLATTCGTGPHGGDIPQVAPLPEALGVQPQQRPSGERQDLGCARAVFGPFATAAQWRRWDGGSVVSPRAVWCWGHMAGQPPWSPSRRRGPPLREITGRRPRR